MGYINKSGKTINILVHSTDQCKIFHHCAGNIQGHMSTGNYPQCLYMTEHMVMMCIHQYL